jgi:hypothetical protein
MSTVPVPSSGFLSLSLAVLSISLFRLLSLARALSLYQVTYDCWMEAINICKPGVPYNAIGGVIEDYVTKHGMSTTRNYCGHGVGRVFHTTPNIVHYKVCVRVRVRVCMCTDPRRHWLRKTRVTGRLVGCPRVLGAPEGVGGTIARSIWARSRPTTPYPRLRP